MATGRVLPPEVVEHILDKLATSEVSDLRTLATCSLVCRTWLPRSSAHVLKSISVPAQDLERYLAFAKTSARLATHVREFTLTGSVNVIRYLDAMFAIMPKLNHLELRNNFTTLKNCTDLGILLIIGTIACPLTRRKRRLMPTVPVVPQELRMVALPSPISKWITSSRHSSSRCFDLSARSNTGIPYYRWGRYISQRLACPFQPRKNFCRGAFPVPAPRYIDIYCEEHDFCRQLCHGRHDRLPINRTHHNHAEGSLPSQPAVHFGLFE